MAAELTGSNPDFITYMPALGDDADIQVALKLLLYGETANSTALAGVLTATDGSDGLVGHLNTLKNSLTNYVAKTSFTGKGTLLSASAASTPLIVAAGTNNHVLRANSSTASGVEWYNPSTTHLALTAGASSPLTGNLTVSLSTPKLILNDTSSTNSALVEFQDASTKKWEVGKDSSDNFVINSGAANVISIDATTSRASVQQIPTANKDIATKEYVDKSMPIGSVTAYTGASAPAGWLVCDGSAVSRTTYASLFAVCGTSYGGGDGSTTFNLPNMVDRFVKGAGTGVARGTTGGSNTISTSQMPSHNHTGSISINAVGDHVHSASAAAVGDHQHKYNAQYLATTMQTASPGSSVMRPEAGGTTSNLVTPSGAHTHGITVLGGGAHTPTGSVTINSNGSGSVFEPKFCALYYIVKAA